MTAELGLVVLLASVVLAVVIGTKCKTNIGIVGLAFAFIIGTMMMGKTIAQVISYFPTSLLFMMMVVTMFYGFSSGNGSMQALADRIIYASRKKLVLVPIILYVACFVIATLGAGASAAPIILSPIAFTLASSMGFSPVLAFLACALGSLAGGIQPWTSTGILFKGIAMPIVGEEVAESVAWNYGLVLFIVPTAFFLICYFVFKGYKVSEGVEVKKPEPMTKQQKQTLAIVAAVMILVIVPVFTNMFVPNPVTKWFVSKFDIKVLCIFGSIVCAAMNLGDTKKIIKDNIPWGTIIMVCGMSTMIGVAVESGVADLVGSWIGDNIPTWLVLPLVCLLGGLLSFVTTGAAVIYPLFIHMFPAISEATGISVVALVMAIFAGVGATGMSPFSQGGAMSITGCKDEAVRNSLWGKQLILASLFLLFYVVLAMLGLFDFAATIF